MRSEYRIYPTCSDLRDRGFVTYLISKSVSGFEIYSGSRNEEIRCAEFFPDSHDSKYGKEIRLNRFNRNELSNLRRLVRGDRTEYQHTPLFLAFVAHNGRALCAGKFLQLVSDSARFLFRQFCQYLSSIGLFFVCERAHRVIEKAAQLIFRLDNIAGEEKTATQGAVFQGGIRHDLTEGEPSCQHPASVNRKEQVNREGHDEREDDSVNPVQFRQNAHRLHVSLGVIAFNQESAIR